MAITKIIAIRDRLDKRVNYAVNGEKTTLDTGITYATNPEKTEQLFFTSAINCESCETAFAEMQATKQRFGKLGGVVGYHFIQSFAPGEVTPEQAHRIGVEFAERLFGKRHEAVIGTHLDRNRTDKPPSDHISARQAKFSARFVPRYRPSASTSFRLIPPVYP